MAEATVITVRLKDDEKSLTIKNLCYDNFNCSENDPIIRACVSDAMKQFDGEPTDVRVTITLEVM